MNFADVVLFFWLIPVAFQILLPLVLFCGWMVFKIPSLLFGAKSSIRNVEPSFAR